MISALINVDVGVNEHNTPSFCGEQEIFCLLFFSFECAILSDAFSTSSITMVPSPIVQEQSTPLHGSELEHASNHKNIHFLKKYVDPQ